MIKAASRASWCPLKHQRVSTNNMLTKIGYFWLYLVLFLLTWEIPSLRCSRSTKIFFWILFKCVPLWFKERTNFIADFLLYLVRFWAVIVLGWNSMGPYRLGWWWRMSWAMNLKGHKVFQFGRLRGLKNH